MRFHLGGTMSARSLLFKLSLPAVCALLLASGPARALQPLQAFLDSARDGGSPDVLEAEATARQQDALADVQLGRALPGINVRGTYTHNQYDAVFAFQSDAGMGTMGQPGFVPPTYSTITIQPYNQFDLYATLNVPLIDLAQFKRISAARKNTEVSLKQAEATQLQVSGAVAQAYYQLVANLALVEASKRQLEVSSQSLALTSDRFKLGATPELDVDRAKSQSEQQVQQLASANLQLAIAARSLFATSGLEPVIDTLSDFTGDLHQEAALEEYAKQLDNAPNVQAAALTTQQAEASRTAQNLTLVPSLAGSFTEHLSNAPGFTGSDASYQLLIAATWNIDFTNFANNRAADAAADAARARELRARLAAGTAISNDWNAVKAAIARSQSARAEVSSSKHGADIALDRYKAGSSTQLDLLQAQRDAFTAEVSRIQADADLANSRAQLRLSVGKSLDNAAVNTTTNTPANQQGVQPK
jgi:outer membrane protein TolC